MAEHVSADDYDRARLTKDDFCGACSRLKSEPPIPECIKPEWHIASAETAEGSSDV